MADERIGLGFIGAGDIVRTRHLPGFENVPGVEFAAVANRSRESASQVAADFGIAEVCGDWREVIDHPKVDAVVIGTWPYKHSEYGIAALEAGKHVFSQARLAMDAADARRMVAAARESDLTTMVCPPPHGMRVEPTVMRMVGDGFLGNPRHVVVRDFQSGYVEAASPLHWRQVSEYSGVHTLTLGIFAEIVGRWFGDVAEVSAVDATFTSQRPLGGGSGSGAVDRPDSVFVAGRMESGATAAFAVSGVVGAPSGNVIEGYGSRGSLRYLIDEDRLLQASAPDWEEGEVQIAPADEGGWRVEEEFIQAIREGRSGNPSWEEGLKYMQFVEAVEESARTGRSVAVASV